MPEADAKTKGPNAQVDVDTDAENTEYPSRGAGTGAGAEQTRADLAGSACPSQTESGGDAQTDESVDVKGRA